MWVTLPKTRLPIHWLSGEGLSRCPSHKRQQPAPESNARTCDQFDGMWTGTFSQGQYGTQRIDVRHVFAAARPANTHMTMGPSEMGADLRKFNDINRLNGTSRGRWQLRPRFLRPQLTLRKR